MNFTLSTALVFAAMSDCGGGSSSDDDPSSWEFSCADYAIMLDVEIRIGQECSEASECGQVLDGAGCGCETDDPVVRLDFDTAYFYDLLDEATAAGCSVDLGTGCACPSSDGFACRGGDCTWE